MLDVHVCRIEVPCSVGIVPILVAYGFATYRGSHGRQRTAIGLNYSFCKVAVRFERIRFRMFCAFLFYFGLHGICA